MPNPLEELYKVCESAGTMVTAGWGFIGKVQKRFNQIREIRDRGGQQGAFFFLTYTSFLYVYGAALVLCGLAGLGVLVGGIAEIVKAPEGLPFLTPLFDNYAFHILALAIFIFLIAVLNALSWIPILLLVWIPAKFLPLRQFAGWYNLWQFSVPLGDPKPLFTNRNGISSLADAAILKLQDGGPSNEDFAATPADLSLDERSNVALIGCLLEKEHGIRGWQRRKWQPFYAAIAAAEANKKKMVSPDFLIHLSGDVDFFGTLVDEVNRRLPESEPKVPDSAEARYDLSNAVKLLVKKYKGSARNIAFTRWSHKPNLRVAFNRSLAFTPFDVRSMVPQFLKLSVRWGIWPDVEPGNFIYPYGRNLAVLLFEKHAIVTLSTVKSFAFQEGGQLAVYRETMRRTVSRIRELLSASAKPQHREILARYPTEWQLAAAADFALWAYSSELKKTGGLKEWKLDDSGFVSRQGDTDSAKDDSEDSTLKEI
jgi:hypothetical protein